MMDDHDGAKRILVISQYYTPEPSTLAGDFAEYCSRQGHDVTVITGHPNYPGGRYYKSVTSARPHGDVVDGVRVWRLPFFLDHSSSALRRLISYTSFTAIASLWSIFACRRPDIVVCYQTPFTVGLAGLFFRYIRGSSLVFLSADLWPESLVASGLSSNTCAVRAMYWFSRWINRQADLIVAMTRGMEKRYLDDGIPTRKTLYVPFWFRYEKLADESSEKDILSINKNVGEQKISIVYAGNLGPPQALETVLKAARILAHQDPRIHFDFYGSGHLKESLQQLAQAWNLTNVTFHGYISKSLLAGVLRRAHAAIVHLANHESFATTVPSKLYFYLANHVPVLVGVPGETADLARECQGALLFEPENSQSLAQACLQVATWNIADRDRLASCGREYYFLHMEPNKILKKVEAAILKSHSDRVQHRWEKQGPSTQLKK